MLLSLAKEQKALGHDVTICTMFGDGRLDERAREYGLKHYKLNSGKGILANIRSLNAFLRDHPQDVVHSHWGVWLTTAVTGWLRKTPRVHTHHSNQMRRLFIEHRIASLLTDKVVSLTPELDQYISKWVDVPARKMAVITNGLDLSRFHGIKPAHIEGIPDNATVVGMVARLCIPKDYSTFMRAVQLVEAKFNDVHFIAVGDGILTAQFKAEAAELGLKNFHFIGARLDVPAVLRRMTIKVLATWNEGLSISLLEAMASGCACIASDIPANRFTLDNGNAGLLVPGRDPGALAEAIERLLTDPALREKLHLGAQRRIEDFTSKRMAEEYIALYDTLQHKHKAR